MEQKINILRKMSDDELITEFKSVCDSVHNTECFSAQDLVWEGMLMREIERRGYQITLSAEVVE